MSDVEKMFDNFQPDMNVVNALDRLKGFAIVKDVEIVQASLGGLVPEIIPLNGKIMFS